MEEQQEAEINPILGVDPSEDQVNDFIPEEQEEQPVEETQPPVDNRIAELEEKARIYDLIDGDPRLTHMIMDYMQRKNGVVNEYSAAPTQPTQQTQQAPEPNDAVAQMQKRLELMEQGQRQLLATISLQQFEMSNPDFKNYKSEVGTLLKKHPTYTLQEAYDLVKSAKVGLSTQSVSTPSAQAEGPSRVVSQSQGLEDLASMQRKLANRKAVQSDDDAFAMAFNFAQKQAKRGE